MAGAGAEAGAAGELSPGSPSETAPLDRRNLLPDLAAVRDGGEGAPIDLLEHDAIAAALADAIRGMPTGAPLGVALYGAWGQGKSTIGRLLCARFGAEIKDGRYVFVNIDAWKYAHEGSHLPLRRHFLLQAYESAGFEKEALELRQAFRHERVRRELRLQQSAYRPVLDALAAALRWTWPRALTLGLFVALATLLVPLGAITTATRWLLAAFFGLVAGGLTLLREVFFVQQRDDPAWSVEEFDEYLGALLERTNRHVSRFIFFIDDLDRCEDDLVVEAIETLQAFFGRARCAYVVAADESQLKRAVRRKSQGPATPGPFLAVIPADETFLEKIFQVSVDVPRPSRAAIESYAREVAGETRLAGIPDGERENILSYLVHPRVRSPRQVRVILNQFLLLWAQAEAREATPKAHLRAGLLSANTLLLAKLVVLRSHFPWFYDLLFEDPALLRGWQLRALGEDRDAPLAGEMVRRVESAAAASASEGRAFSRASGDEDDEEPPVESLGAGRDNVLDALRSYLALTRNTLPRTDLALQEFLYLRSRREFAGLLGTEGESYLVAISSGDITALESLVRRAPEQALQAARVAIALARDGSQVQTDAAMRSVLALAPLLSERDIRSVGPTAARLLYGGERAGLSMVDERTARGHSALVPWAPREAIRRLEPVLPLNDAALVTAFAERAAEVSGADAWGEVVRRALPFDRAAEVPRAIAQSRPRTVRTLTPTTIAAVRRVLEAPTERIDDRTMVLASIDVDDNWLTFADPSGEGAGAEVYVPQRLGLTLASLPVNASYTISYHRDADGDWELEKILDGSETILAQSRRVPASNPVETDSAWRILESVAERLPAEGQASLGEIASFDYQTAGEALRAANLLLRATGVMTSTP